MCVCVSSHLSGRQLVCPFVSFWAQPPRGLTGWKATPKCSSPSVCVLAFLFAVFRSAVLGPSFYGVKDSAIPFPPVDLEVESIATHVMWALGMLSENIPSSCVTAPSREPTSQTALKILRYYVCTNGQPPGRTEARTVKNEPTIPIATTIPHPANRAVSRRLRTFSPLEPSNGKQQIHPQVPRSLGSHAAQQRRGHPEEITP